MIQNEEEEAISSLTTLQESNIPVHEHAQGQRIKSAVQFCHRCRQISFRRIAELSPAVLQASYNGVEIGEIGTRCSELPNNDCALCRFFLAGCGRQGCCKSILQLRAYSFLQQCDIIRLYSCGKQIKEADLACLTVTHGESFQKAYIFCLDKIATTTRAFIPQILHGSIDMLRCKEWVTYCKENHRKLCEFIPAQYAVLRLIDCNAFKVVTATSKPLYVALSYTWGSNPINRGGDGFPRTIRDAIAVTKAVGYNYLWVDQYCIDQANNVEKHEQIQQMDLIYRGAELTVIVTVGSGVNDGLPGVLDTPRASTQVLDLEQYTLVFGMPHPHRTIPTTKWSTRAWTLQEATLSRRRLVFTEFQTYFECNGMNCCESFQENRQLLHSQKGDKALRFMHSGIFSTRATSDFTSFSTEKPELRLQRLREIIIEYSSRDLSYDEDSLNAIAGIITHFCEIEATSSTVSHLYGLPFLYRDGQIQHFSHGFLWIHDIKTSEDAYRRENFPSWSWVGWCGRIWFPTYIGISPDRIWLELVEGSRVLMTQHINRIISTKSPEQALPKVIYIDAEIMNVAEMRITAKGEAYKLRLGGHGGQLYWSGITPDPIELVQRFRNRRYDLLYLGETWHLVVENHPGFAARVGLAHIYCGRDDLLDYILERRHVRLY